MAGSYNHSMSKTLNPSVMGPNSSTGFTTMNNGAYWHGDTSTATLLNYLSGVPIFGKIFGNGSKQANAAIDRQFQEYMTRLGFEFSDEQRRLQNQWNYASTKYFTDYNHELNSYGQQVKEMMQEGLNPAMMFGEGQLSGNNSSMSAPTSSAPSGSGSGIGSIGSSFASGETFSDITQAYSNLADAQLKGAQTNEINQLLENKVQDLQLRNEYQKIINQYQGKLSIAQIENILADTDKKYQEIDNLIKEGDLVQAQKLLVDMQREHEEEKKYKTKAEREMAEELSKRREEIVQKDLDKKQSEIDLNNANKDFVQSQNYYYPRVVATMEKNATAAIMNAAANQLSASAQDYVSRHPNDIQGFLVKAFQGAFGNPEEFGKWVMEKLGLEKDEATGIIKRIKRTGKVPDWIVPALRNSNFDPSNLNLQ